MATAVPMNATNEQICEMSHDNVGVGNFSIMTDGNTVWLSEHPMGSDKIQGFEIDRETFNKLIDWYTSGDIPAEDEASRRAKKK